ncbi:unnamed protein product [Thlaspi arvense]|uniref:Uncharacterized protein n=1 Tax=Thlaspi arvense TaxID=13288 RepID=A0AAU9RMD6_THLAR|nr:unnamed protein product [Thlaspi arvense]
MYIFQMLNANRARSQPRSTRSVSLGGMDYADPKKKNNVVGKVLLAATLTTLCIIMLKQSPSFTSPSLTNTQVLTGINMR